MGKISRRDIRPSLAAEEWKPLAEIFTNLSAIRPRRTWLGTGMSERLGAYRMDRLLRSREAVRFDAAVAGLSRDDLRRLSGMARINLEQAQAASRITIFLNVTILVAALVLSNQLAPGWLRLLWETGDAGLRVTIATGAVALMGVWAGVSAYSWGGVAAARDLKHLLEIRLDAMASTLSETDPGDTVADLRSAQLSDL